MAELFRLLGQAAELVGGGGETTYEPQQREPRRDDRSHDQGEREPQQREPRRSALGIAIAKVQEDFDEGKNAGAFPGWEQKRSREFGLIASAIGAARRADRNGDDRAGREALRQARQVLDEVATARKASRVVPYKPAGAPAGPTILVDEPTGRIVAEGPRRPQTEERPHTRRQERDTTPPPPEERAPRTALGWARKVLRDMGREEDLSSLVQDAQDAFDEARTAANPDKFREATILALSVVALCHNVPEGSEVVFAEGQLAIWRVQWELEDRKATGAFTSGARAQQWREITGALGQARALVGEGKLDQVEPALEPAWAAFASLDREGEAAGRTIEQRLAARSAADEAALEAHRAVAAEAAARRERLLAQVQGRVPPAPVGAAPAPPTPPAPAKAKEPKGGPVKKDEAPRGRGAARRRAAEQAAVEAADDGSDGPGDEPEATDTVPEVVAAAVPLATIGDAARMDDEARKLVESVREAAGGSNGHKGGRRRKVVAA